MKYTLLENVVRFAKKHSDDPGTKVGACVVSNGSHTFGANRFYSLPNGMTKEEVLINRELKLKHITHAEVDAIEHADNVKGATIYVNYTPCDKCARKIAEAGIVKVVSMKMTDPALIERWTKYWVLVRFRFSMRFCGGCHSAAAVFYFAGTSNRNVIFPKFYLPVQNQLDILGCRAICHIVLPPDRGWDFSDQL